MKLDRRALSVLALGQGAYYLVTGLWPLLHIRSFMAVTGPKTDVWLVKTVSLLLSAIGADLIWARQRPTAISGLALASCFSLGAIDVYYSLKGRISRIYLLDGLIQGMLALFWVGLLSAAKRLNRSAAFNESSDP
jgi:hypothetical protein